MNIVFLRSFSFSFFNFKVFNILFKDRVTKPQKKMLITLLRETKYMEGKKEKEWYWEKIQEALNKIGPKKTIIQWKKVSDYVHMLMAYDSNDLHLPP